MSADHAHFGPVADAGCEGRLEDPAAGCVQATSEDENHDACESKHVNDRSAGCAQADDAAADAAAPKTRPTTLREFERALRTLGFNKAESIALARGGFKALDRADKPADFELLRQALARRASALNIESSS